MSDSRNDGQEGTNYQHLDADQVSGRCRHIDTSQADSAQPQGQEHVRHGEEIKQLNDKIQELSRNLEDHQKREINLTKKNDDLISRNIALEEKIYDLRRTRQNAPENEIEVLRKRNIALEEKIDDLRRTSRHGEEIQQLNDKIQELSRNLQDHQKRNIALEKERGELRIRNNALEKKMEDLRRTRNNALEKEIEDLRCTRNNALEKEIEDLRWTRKNALQKEIGDLRWTRNSALEKEIGDLRWTRNNGLEKEIEDLRWTRLSSFTSAKLMDGNPEITDLSNPNRPTKIAEMYSELYDIAWTDAFDVLSKLESEETAIGILLDILLISYQASTNCVKEKWNNFSQKMESSKLDENTLERTRKEKINLKKNFKRGQESIRQPILDEIQKQVKLPAESDKDSMVMEYIDQVVKITWLMAVQDPMVYVENKIVRRKPWDKNKYKEYTKRGDTIDFVVWPPLLLHEGGPLLMKGVAQGKQHGRTPARDGKQVGGATYKEETGAARNESCKDKFIEAKPGNDPELSSNRTASGSADQGRSKVTDNENQKPTYRTSIYVGSASKMNVAEASERKTSV